MQTNKIFLSGLLCALALTSLPQTASAMDASAKGYNWAKIGVGVFGAATVLGAYWAGQKSMVCSTVDTKQNSPEQEAELERIDNGLRLLEGIDDVSAYHTDSAKNGRESQITSVLLDAALPFAARVAHCWHQKYSKDQNGEVYYALRDQARVELELRKTKQELEIAEQNTILWSSNVPIVGSRRSLWLPCLTGLAAVGCWWKALQAR